MKLDFVVPGFSKCGTTTLCALLSEHPQIYLSRQKEPNFFAYKFDKGWNWYRSLFDSAEPQQLCGEGSTCYSSAEFAEQSCERLLEYFPEVRFIFIARNPLTRLESSYRQMHNSGHKWAAHPPYCLGKTLQQFPNLVEDTQYWARINAYRNRVGDDRIHVLFLEDLEHNPTEELKKCFEFLGVAADVQIKQPERRWNRGERKYYDTWIMRYIRTHEWTRTRWLNLPLERRFELIRKYRLRKPFRKPVHWPRLARQIVMRDVHDDARHFLSYYGKTADYWNLDNWFQATPQRRAA